jgi:sulfate permease, SulP family
VSWNMVERSEIWGLIRTSSGDALVLVVTFLLVTFRDLTEGIIVGFALGGVLFIKRMSEHALVERGAAFTQDDRPDEGGRYEPQSRDDPVVVYRIRGAFFFGAASTVSAVLDRIADRPRAFVVDFAEVPFLDSTAAHAMEMLARKLARHGGTLYLTGASTEVRRVLLAQGVREPLAHYRTDMAAAVEEAHRLVAT